MFTQAGLQISSGQISHLLLANQEGFHQERAAILRAGVQRSPWQHIDTTCTRVGGTNQPCHVVCNPLYTVYTTLPQQDRCTSSLSCAVAHHRAFALMRALSA